jgi:hypothetical protein
MVSRTALAWAACFLLLLALAVPWFLWRNDALFAGLPVWLWWHVAWMLVTAVAFAAFASRDWGLFVEVGR